MNKVVEQFSLIGRSRFQRYYLTRVNQGLCVKCGEKNDRLPQRMCTLCVGADRLRQKEYRNKLIKKGICTVCHQRLPRKR